MVLTGAKTYDATTNASGLTISNDLNGANLTVSGTGTLTSANAGSEAFASSGSLALGGSAAGNYTLANVTTNGSAESVGQLAVVLSGSKTYDATTNAAASGLTISNDLNGANLTLSGTGTLTSANAGSEGFAAAGSLTLGGSAAGNYTLVGITSNGSAETVGQLAVVLSGAKTYDATTNAAASTLTISNDLNGANLTLSGTGTLTSANAGSESFAAAGSLALGGSAAGNYTLVGITSNGSAETVGQLAVVLTGTKTFDATTNAPAANLTISNNLDGGNLTLSGTGTLASANPGSELFAAAGSLALRGSAGGNYTLSGVTTNGSAVTIGADQIVSGDVFSGHGVSPLTGASVSLILGGTSEGTVTSGAGGAYQFELPLGTISPSGTGLFVYISSGPVTGSSFYNAATGPIAGLDIYGSYFRVLNAPASLTQTGAALAATLGSNANPANFLFTLGAGNALNLAGSNFELAAPTPAAFTIDETVNAASFAVTASEISLAANVTTTARANLYRPRRRAAARRNADRIEHHLHQHDRRARRAHARRPRHGDARRRARRRDADGRGLDHREQHHARGRDLDLVRDRHARRHGDADPEHDDRHRRNRRRHRPDGPGQWRRLHAHAQQRHRQRDALGRHRGRARLHAVGAVARHARQRQLRHRLRRLHVRHRRSQRRPQLRPGDELRPATVISPSTITSPGVPIDFTSTLTGVSASLAIEPGTARDLRQPARGRRHHLRRSRPPPTTRRRRDALSGVEPNTGVARLGLGHRHRHRDRRHRWERHIAGTSDTGTGSGAGASSTGTAGATALTGATGDVVSTRRRRSSTRWRPRRAAARPPRARARSKC